MHKYLFLLTLIASIACSSKKNTGTPPPGDISPPPECGNDIRIGDEACDGTDLAGETCVSLGYDGGELACDNACAFDTTSCTGTGPVCGDDHAEGLEACDGTDLRSETCNTLGFEGGDLGCTDCAFDTGNCTGTAPECGDDNAEGLEECDGIDLRQLDCADLGFDGGLLACDDTCRLNTGGCSGTAQFCGDGRAEGLEECDTDDLNGITCQVLGYDDGIIACNGDCTFDVADCTGTPAVCGDGTRDGLEECDGDDLDQTDCMDLDFVGGTLVCDSSCSFDATGCTSPECGNDQSEPGEECDGNDVGGQDCTDLGLGEGDLTCLDDCTFDTSACQQPICGDGAVNRDEEQCDGNDNDGESCRSLTFRGGDLQCTDDCTFDLTYCWGTTAECGDDERAISEECEGADLGDAECLSIGFDGGDLSCADDCTFDTSLCTGTGPVCGNELVEYGELCDGDNLQGAVCEDFGFTGGTLVCNATLCVYVFAGCTFEPTCPNDDAERGEVCDGTDLRGATCESLNLGTGDLACLGDCSDYDFTGCTLNPVCGNSTIEGFEICDDTDLGAVTSCTDFGYTGTETPGCLPTCADYDLSACTGEPNRCGNGRAQGPEQCDDTDLRDLDCTALGYSDGDLACNANCSFDVSGCTL